MNIAILTLPLHTNFGGIMQAYALLNFLKQNNHEVTFISRSFNKNKFNLVNLLITTALQPIIAYNINKFIKNHIHPKTEKIDSSEKLEFINDIDIDTVIVGSDQVWRIDYVINMYKDYFLSFIKNKNIRKISYAASFGNEEWNHTAHITSEIKELLQDFTAISVREKSGLNICKDNFDIKNVTHVLDPTLLLEKKDYLNIIGSKKKIKHNGILIYFLDLDEKKEACAKFISSELNLNIFSVNVKMSFSKKNLFKIYKCIYPSVENWIAGFHYCEFVITDSFHGLVFALIFEKPFIVIANEKRGVSRFTSLLDIIGMRHRMLFDFDKISKEFITETIDYNTINEKLSIHKQISKEYLLSNIEK